MAFNPFNKPIGTRLTEEDLNTLIGRVAEGYYVEYKQAFRENKKIAQSIASFANAYGGWYIVGVTTDENHFAKEICGFSTEECSDPVMKVRDIIKSRIDPIPVFSAMPVPLSESGRAALVVYVPGGQQTPFIVDDGRIYRRNHDSSDPVSESSRHTLDRLVEQGREVNTDFARFCERFERLPPRVQLPLSKPEPRWLNLFLSPMPTGIVNRSNISDPAEIDRLLAMSKNDFSIGPGSSARITFGMVLPSYASVTLKGMSSERPHDPGTLVRLDAAGRLAFNLPFNSPRLRDIYESITNLRSKLAVIDQMKHYESAATVDIGHLFVSVMTFLTFYKMWLSGSEWIPKFRVALSVRGVENAIPFAEVPAWATQVEKWGLPILQGDVLFPPRWEDASIISLPDDEYFWLPVFRILSRALGLSDEVAYQAVAAAVVRFSGQTLSPDFNFDVGE